MTIVRVILVETTLPVKIRPRIETSPVKGHFLSDITMNSPSIMRQMYRRTDVSAVDSFRRGLESKTNILVPPLVLGRYFLAAFIPAIIIT